MFIYLLSFIKVQDICPVPCFMDISPCNDDVFSHYVSLCVIFCHRYHTSFGQSPSQDNCQTLLRRIQNKGSLIVTLYLDIFKIRMFAQPNLANCLLAISRMLHHLQIPLFLLSQLFGTHLSVAFLFWYLTRT